tara:strand:- start:1416 stop:2075 length:660 start_codon:yes stop_codon:yes gene_type:complete
MALRILPFRQYDENDVVNLFALAPGYENTQTTDSGNGDAGVFVSVASGNFNMDPIEYTTNSYLGKTDYPFVGRNQYPSATLKVKPAVGNETAGTEQAAEQVLGITLLQTAKQDENEEKLLYNPQKREELQCVLPGQAVPVATRGIFTITADACADNWSPHTIGTGIKISVESGKITGCNVNDAKRMGTVIGTGSRTAGSENDQFAGSGTKKYLVVALGL